MCQRVLRYPHPYIIKQTNTNDFRYADHSEDTDVQKCLSATHEVLTHGSMQLVVAHFPSGAVAASADGAEFLIPSVNIPTQSIQGTNGAGDAFAAGLFYGLHEEWDVSAAMKLGHASAAASVRGLGTTDTVVSWQKCLELASDWGWRYAL